MGTTGLQEDRMNTKDKQGVLSDALELYNASIKLQTLFFSVYLLLFFGA